MKEYLYIKVYLKFYFKKEFFIFNIRSVYDLG